MKLIAALRSIIFYCALAAITLLWFIPFILFALLLPAKRKNIVISHCYGHSVLWLARLICGIKWQVEGLQNLPKNQQSYMILSKHQSTWETFFIAVTCAPQVSVVKKELFYIPVFGWIFALLEPIFIDRKKRAHALKQVLRQGKNKLDQGINVTIFPEGTRVALGQRHPFSRGGAILATQTKVPVIAVAHNAAICWPNQHWIKHSGTIKVVFSPIFASQNLSASDLNTQVETWVNQQVDSLPNN